MSGKKCPQLSPEPARTDLTDRECAKLLCAQVGVLCQMAPLSTVRKAAEWVAASDEFWQYMQQVNAAMRSEHL